MTTALTMPGRWASNVNYSTGPDSGTPTKVDPSSDANGFIRGVVAAPQQVNYLVAPLALAARRLLTLALLKPRLLPLTIDDIGGIAVASRGRGHPALVGNAHSGGVPLASDGTVILGGAVTSITGAVRGAAYNPTAGRFVLVGAGGNRSCFSDDGGTTWSAGGDLGGSGLELIWNPTYSRFQALYSGHARYSTNGAAWTDVALTGALGRGLALLPNGNTYALTAEGPIVVKESTNGGTSWGTAGGTPPNPADFVSRGHICGRGLDYIWHAGVRTSDGRVQVSRSSDGSTWGQIAQLDVINSIAFANSVVIMQCPDTGVLFLVAGLADGSAAIYSSLDGGTLWGDPLFTGALLLTIPLSVSAAHGKLFFSDVNGGLYSSDGIGWE